MCAKYRCPSAPWAHTCVCACGNIVDGPRSPLWRTPWLIVKKTANALRNVCATWSTDRRWMCDQTSEFWTAVLNLSMLVCRRGSRAICEKSGPWILSDDKSGEAGFKISSGSIENCYENMTATLLSWVFRIRNEGGQPYSNVLQNRFLSWNKSNQLDFYLALKVIARWMYKIIVTNPKGHEKSL